jgi:hypothetical protein
MQTHAIYTNLSESVTLVCEQCHRSRALQPIFPLKPKRQKPVKELDLLNKPF